MREAIPVIDAALDKIVRLTGGFRVTANDSWMQPKLDAFVKQVQVGPCSHGLRQFVTIYLDSLLTYGNAIGEIVLDADGKEIVGLYNSNLDHVHIKAEENPMEAKFYTRGIGGFRPVPNPELLLFTPLNPSCGELKGNSLLRSLPFVSSILLEIFQTTHNNFKRLGNLRYAVTYHPGSSAVDRTNAKEIANTMAEQWSDVMASQQSGVIKDFVAVGDVEVKVIGADCQVFDTQIPVRQLMEQIVAKLGIPPFMLGLHWATTERMSTQQADILTSELASYRHHLEGAIVKICETFLRLEGSGSNVQVEWTDLNLRDQLEEANVRLVNAQAAVLEKQLGGEQND